MPNLPKPPKLYYYLAGLAIFIIILGSVGFYFYQKNDKSTITSTPAQTPISLNSLTSNLEESKVSTELNNKPKEQNLTSATNPENQISSASFDADPNTDVIVFEECGISLKVNKVQNLKAYYHRDQINGLKNSKVLILTYNYSETNSPSQKKFYSDSIACGEEYSKTSQLVKADKLPPWLSPFKNAINFEFDGSNIYFKVNNSSYKLTDVQINNFKTFVITSIKFNTENVNKSATIPVTNLSKILETNFTLSDYEKNYKKVKDISILGCNEYVFLSNFCFLVDENSNPIFDLNQYKSKEGNYIFAASFLSIGKKSLNGRYVINDYGDVCAVSTFVYEFNFSSGSIEAINSNKTLQQSSCADMELNEMQVDAECFKNSKKGADAKNCFKISKEYQTYLKAYNDEQAKKKAAEKELAKYLE